MKSDQTNSTLLPFLVEFITQSTLSLNEIKYIKGVRKTEKQIRPKKHIIKKLNPSKKLFKKNIKKNTEKKKNKKKESCMFKNLNKATPFMFLKKKNFLVKIKNNASAEKYKTKSKFSFSKKAYCDFLLKKSLYRNPKSKAFTLLKN